MNKEEIREGGNKEGGRGNGRVGWMFSFQDLGIFYVYSLHW